MQPELINEGSLAWKLWTLIKTNYNITTFTKAMYLLKKVAWSANITEQGHAAASQVMEKHGQCTGSMMQDRALVLQLVYCLGVSEVKRQSSDLNHASLHVTTRRWISSEVVTC